MAVSISNLTNLWAHPRHGLRMQRVVVGAAAALRARQVIIIRPRGVREDGAVLAIGDRWQGGERDVHTDAVAPPHFKRHQMRAPQVKRRGAPETRD